MSRYDYSDGTVAAAQRSDLRNGHHHTFASPRSPLSIADRRGGGDDEAHAYGQQHQQYYEEQERGAVMVSQSRSAAAGDTWMYQLSDAGHPLGMEGFWNGPTGASPPDASGGGNINKHGASNAANAASIAGGSGTGSRVASNAATGTSTPSSATTTSTAQRVSTFLPASASATSSIPGGTSTSPLAYPQNNALYSFAAELRGELEPLLQPPSTNVIPIPPVSLSSGLPPHPLDVNYSSSVHHHSQSPVQSTHNRSPSRSTLWWGELEPWMDEEYAKQVCGLMGWDTVTVKIPHTPADPITGQQPNNPGYCFLTFPSSQHASAVLNQINRAPSEAPVNMPNSAKPFVLNWASSPTPSPATASFNAPVSAVATAQAQQKEYSIFVGDLAPETSNSDLVAVFRNPVLGLRNDRAPKFIRPFYSCKSAKIMLDPVTGVSRGYGFVRFTDEGDQQRALIEMHGLYCLSRPMRISPATAKFKVPAGGPGDGAFGAEQGLGDVPAMMTVPPVTASLSGSSLGSSGSVPSMTTSSTVSSVSSYQPNGAPTITSLDALAQLIAKANGDTKQAVGGKTLPSITSSLVDDQQQKLDESWKHQEQARAILGNLIGPNGEQLTSTDPYNTTVFVGGLSPLISEETLRTFFAPFGDIHYVKVPTGKHCGFVQFVRKADAERAIERMQGFPIGGSRIRLSWGRSQYKAAQAAAQAAATAQAQALQSNPAGMLGSQVQLTQEQVLEMLQKLGYGGFTNGNGQQYAESETSKMAQSFKGDGSMAGYDDGYGYEGIPQRMAGFSPFSPDPNYLASLMAERETSGSRGTEVSRSQSSFGGQDRMAPMKQHAGGSGRTMSPSGQDVDQSVDTYGFALNKSATPFQLNRAPGRPNVDGSRPSSSQALPGYSAERERSSLRDFHGHMSSLDVDNANIPAHSPGATTDSSGSVMFRMSPGSSPQA